VSAWAAALPRDVVFKRVPVSYGRPAWMNLARAYYSLEATGDLKRLDAALFHAIHDEQQSLFDEQSLADWVGRQGGDAARFANAYASFGVNNQTVQADQMVEDLGITAVPTLVVNGRYVVVSPEQSADEEQTFRQLLALTDKVIALARAGAPRAAAPTAPQSAAAPK
jgi:thiol:disulfide interchange protein DsbA